ncbi:MAG TPA: SRPBCC family protein, partial [Polyangiaceae bacterium]|nr:SRPBCC family protein [Polyangiaceae bacterium]
WFSIGLGLAQIMAPRAIARTIGLRADDESARRAMVALGVREIASGVGILAQRHPTEAVWSRVAGDVMDLALLGRSMTSGDADRGRMAGATAAVAGLTLLDAVTALQLGRGERGREAGASGETERRGVRIATSITIDCTAQQAYRLWRDVQNWPRFMPHLASVEAQGGRSVWRLRGPAGTHLEWASELGEDRPDERLAWRSVEGASVASEGAVSFAPAPGGRGTEVRLELRYEPPGGAAGAAVAKLLGALPAHELAADLRRFKQLVELGELSHSDASIHAGPHPARPAGGPEDGGRALRGGAGQEDA